MFLILCLHPRYRCEARFFNLERSVSKHRSDSRTSSCSRVALGSDTCCSLHQLPSCCCITSLPHPGKCPTLTTRDKLLLPNRISSSNMFLSVLSLSLFFSSFKATQELLAFTEVSEAATRLHRSGRRRTWERQHCWSGAMMKAWIQTWGGYLHWTNFLQQHIHISNPVQLLHSASGCFLLQFLQKDEIVATVLVDYSEP